MSGVVRIEARHLARSALLWLGFGLAAALAAVRMLLSMRLLAGDDLLLYESAFFLDGGAFLAGAVLGLRDHTAGVRDLLAVTPTAPTRLWRARLAAVAATLAVFTVLLFVGGLVVSGLLGGRGVPDPRLPLDRALGVVVSGWVGLAAARLTRSRLVAVLGAPAWVVATAYVPTTGPAQPWSRLGLALSGEWRSVVLGFVPDPFWGHLAYLAGLAALAAIAVLLPGRRAQQPPASPLRLGGAGLAALALTGGAAAWLVAQPETVLVEGPRPSDWRPVTAADLDAPPAPFAYAGDTAATVCVAGQALEVCVYPAFGEARARALLAEADPVAVLLKGLPGVPARLRTVPATNAPCQDHEVQLAEDTARSTAANADLGYLECAVGGGSAYAGRSYGVGEYAQDNVAAVVMDWVAVAATDDQALRSSHLRLDPLEEGRHAADGFAEPDATSIREQAAAETKALQALLALPEEQVLAELAPVWERLRAGELSLDELPGSTP